MGWMVGDEVKMVPDDSGNVVIMSYDASASVLAHDIVHTNSDVLSSLLSEEVTQFSFLNILINHTPTYKLQVFTFPHPDLER